MAGNYTQVGNQTFQSTPLVRGTTDYYVPQFANLGISIHVPRERDDFLLRPLPVSRIRFQSTSLVRGTTPRTAYISGSA